MLSKANWQGAKSMERTVWVLFASKKRSAKLSRRAIREDFFLYTPTASVVVGLARPGVSAIRRRG